jgi:hypothetical protein
MRLELEHHGFLLLLVLLPVSFVLRFTLVDSLGLSSFFCLDPLHPLLLIRLGESLISKSDNLGSYPG